MSNVFPIGPSKVTVQAKTFRLARESAAAKAQASAIRGQIAGVNPRYDEDEGSRDRLTGSLRDADGKAIAMLGMYQHALGLLGQVAGASDLNRP